jgi:glycosyltransferase involved in cell wall biosynthesis
MKLAIITQVVHKRFQHQIWAYAPYVKEINLWTKQAHEVILVAPCTSSQPSAIDQAYSLTNLHFLQVPAFSLQGIQALLKSLFVIPVCLFRIIQAMRNADHIHLRCPGNMGLLGCVVQIFFPKKIKTAKYAGNWDPHSKQPWSYKLQRWILQNTFLTRNMSVLVYGEWPNMSRNCKSFFTASYCESDKINTPPRVLDSPIQCLFVGSLTAGKNPFYAIQLVETVSKMDVSIQLKLYGDGDHRAKLEAYCIEHSLSERVQFFGNQDADIVQQAYKSSHFLLLPSQSEGWPKAVAEAMFWGCVPLVTPVSWVPFMLNEQTRGLLLSMDLMQDAQQLFDLLQQPADYESKAAAAMNWSRHYTLDQFEVEISKLLRP